MAFGGASQASPGNEIIVSTCERTCKMYIGMMYGHTTDDTKARSWLFLNSQSIWRKMKWKYQGAKENFLIGSYSIEPNCPDLVDLVKLANCHVT